MEKTPPRPFRFIEVFAGIGGFRVGLERIGGTCVWACELCPEARLTYKVNFGKVPYYDITKADLKTLPAFDLLTGGFPCQDFSTLGEQRGLEGERGKLFFEILRVIRECKPKAILLENVKGLVTMQGGEIFDFCLNQIRAEGYYVNYKVINSNGIVPQYRNRVYIVAFKEEKNSDRLNFIDLPTMKPARKVQEILHDEIEEPFLSHWKVTLAQWKSVKRSKTAKKYGIEKRLCLPTAECADTLVSSYRNSVKSIAQFVAPGGYSKGTVGERPRWFTPRECARLMGFPESFRLHPKEVTACEQLGNAVVPPLIALLGGATISALEDSESLRVKIRDCALYAAVALVCDSTGQANKGNVLSKSVVVNSHEATFFDGLLSNFLRSNASEAQKTDEIMPGVKRMQILLFTFTLLGFFRKVFS